MEQESLEARERIVRLESKVDFITKAVMDHLDHWDSQWIKIDEIKDKLSILETEKRIWWKIIAPTFSICGGVLGGILTYYFQMKLK